MFFCYFEITILSYQQHFPQLHLLDLKVQENDTDFEIM